MGKKVKHTKPLSKEAKPFLLEIHWEKFVIALLFVLPLIYFSSFLSADRMIGGMDYLIGGYPFEKWIGEQEEMPLWYPHVFGGVPVLGSPVGGPLAPLAQLREIIPPQVILALSFIIFFFLAGLGTYLYLKAIGLSPYAAALGAVMYQFIGNLATTPSAGHAGRAASVALFPLMLYFIHSAITSKRLFNFTLFALVTAFAFYEGHFQITYYGLLFIFAYVVYYLITHRKENSGKEVIKIFGYGFLAVLFICLLMAAIWLPVLKGLGTAARGVERGYKYSASWAMPPLELVDLVIPTFSGILDNYWGMNSFKIHLEYFGIIAVIFITLTVVLYWRKSYVKFYAIAALVVVLVAIGSATPFFRIPYALVPGFRLFRAPALIFYLVSFSCIVLCSIGFENVVVHRPKMPSRKLIVIGSSITVLLLVFALVFSLGGSSLLRSMQDAFYPKIVSQWGQQAGRIKISHLHDNYGSLTSGAWRSVVFALLVFGLIYVSKTKRIRVWIISCMFIILALIDQLPLVSKFLPQVAPPKEYYAADDAVRYIREDGGIFRVFPTPWYEHASDLDLLYHNIQSAGGYIPNPLKRYQEFIGAGESVMFNPSNLLQNPKLVDMLNAKYVVARTMPKDISGFGQESQRMIQRILSYLSRFKPVHVGSRNTVYENQNALPRSYFVRNYTLARESQALEIMKSDFFDPWTTVLLEDDPGVPQPVFDNDYVPGTTKILEYKPNKITCQVHSEDPGFLVLLDNWHPDWHAFVDGVKSRMFVANHTFRAVYVPAGTHEVVYVYQSRGFAVGKILTILALAISLVVGIVSYRFRV
jgi:hypothetical protein